jgi:hypothetical protein
MEGSGAEASNSFKNTNPTIVLSILISVGHAHGNYFFLLDVNYNICSFL